jgi:hypothetical protein
MRQGRRPHNAQSNCHDGSAILEGFVRALSCIAMTDRISAPRLASPRLASPPLQGVVPVRDHYLFVVATLRDMPPIVRYFRYRHLEQRAIVFLCPFNEDNSWEDARAAEILSLQVSVTMTVWRMRIRRSTSQRRVSNGRDALSSLSSLSSPLSSLSSPLWT